MRIKILISTAWYIDRSTSIKENPSRIKNINENIENPKPDWWLRKSINTDRESKILMKIGPEHRSRVKISKCYENIWELERTWRGLRIKNIMKYQLNLNIKNWKY